MAKSDEGSGKAKGGTPPDPYQVFQMWTRISGKAQQVATEFWVRRSREGVSLDTDPVGLINTWQQVASNLMNDPERLIGLQTKFVKDSMALWQSFAMPGSAPPPPDSVTSDRRFKSEEWQENQFFNFILQSYLLTAEFLQSLVAETQGLDPRQKAKAQFYTRQFVDAISPTNFLLTNPEALRATVETGGHNLLSGLENLLEDLERGRISMTDEDAFEVGGNVAITPGEVVFECEFFQLIQYAPVTEQVHSTPLLIMPPWINKFYILDLTAQKSFVKWCTQQGLTVFVVSWVNPDETMRDRNFEDYVIEGELKAVDAVLNITGAKSTHVIGYCVAGTALSCLLAYMHATGQEKKIKSATFFTAQVDFSEGGDLCLFVDEDQLTALDKATAEKGYLDAQTMATTFNLLRSNDLIWSYVVNNYLLGRDPFPFDLLYWNADATRMPRAMYLYYLKNMYDQNNLVKPGGVSMGGVPIDLTLVKTPCYIQAGKEDHIAPARSVYKISHHFTGPLKFVLAGSGHIAGVVNPPDQKKYQYWTLKDDKAALPETLDQFISMAKETPGSWWPDWLDWIKPKSGKMVAARRPGSDAYPPIEPAPGRYVKVKS